MQYETEGSLAHGSSSGKSKNENKRGVERVMERMAGESAVVIFSESSCCMCHAIKRLFCGLGVSPTVHELDLLPAGHLISAALDGSSLPLVFVGGKLLGAMDRVMASHINGSLVPLLKDAGALWL